jgi:hypothetical protein
VTELSELLAERIRRLQPQEIAELRKRDPGLAARLDAVRRSRTCDEVTAQWFRADWKKDSGLFPDFVLASDERVSFGNGALLELKDTKGSTLASFNSTIPSRHKSLDEVKGIMGSSAVSAAAALADFPHSATSGYFSRERPCFYLIRTCAATPKSVRISLVEGSFFETLPKGQLLARTWDQLLEASGVPEAERSPIVESLAGLDQAEIAKSRSIAKASVRPRLRLMAEVVSSANPHNYPEVGARSVNLIVKAEWEDDTEWVESSFAGEEIPAQAHADGSIFVQLLRGHPISLRYFRILHKLNGEHLVVQYCLPSAGDSDE